MMQSLAPLIAVVTMVPGASRSDSQNTMKDIHVLDNETSQLPLRESGLSIDWIGIVIYITYPR